MENPYNYRNKAQYPVGLNSDGQPSRCICTKNSYYNTNTNMFNSNRNITENSKNNYRFCKRKKNIQVYNEENQKGLLRHIVIKVGKYTKSSNVHFSSK